MFFVYILYSPQIKKYYVGQTENLEQRIEKYKTGAFENSSTRSDVPWQVFHLLNVLPENKL